MLMPWSTCFPVLFADSGMIYFCYTFDTQEGYLKALEAINARWTA